MKSQLVVTKKLLVYTTILILFGCVENKTIKNDTSALLNTETNLIDKDSILNIVNGKSLKLKNSFDFGYLQIKSITKAKFSDEIDYAYENGYYKYKKTERNEFYLSLVLDMLSKQTPKEKHVELLECKDKYLPRVELYFLDTSQSDPLVLINSFDYEMVNALPDFIRWYEDYFNYKERGKFLFYIKISEKIKSQPLVIIIQNPEKLSDNPYELIQSIVWKKD